MKLAQIIPPLRILFFAALLVGGLAGWFSIITQDGAENVAQSNAQFFLGLGVVLPATLVGYNRMINSMNDRKTLILVGIVSALAGIIAYLTLTTLIAGSVGGEDLNQVRVLIASNIPLWQYGLVIIVQIAISILLPINSQD